MTTNYRYRSPKNHWKKEPNKYKHPKTEAEKRATRRKNKHSWYQRNRYKILAESKRRRHPEAYAQRLADIKAGHIKYMNSLKPKIKRPEESERVKKYYAKHQEERIAYQRNYRRRKKNHRNQIYGWTEGDFEE